jgi:trk system potassium uptake protein TrkH
LRNKTINLTPPQVLALGFILIIFTGGFLLSLPFTSAGGQGTPFIDALFTATSATCVTGLVVVDTAINYSTPGQIIIMFLIQVGGLGFMTFATLFSIIMGKKIGLRERILLKEALNKVSLQGVVRLAKYVLIATFIIEGIATLILALRWSFDFGWKKALYFGLFHSVSAFDNAGFDILGREFGPFANLIPYVSDPVIVLVITTLIFLGGIGFTVLADFYEHRKISKLSLHSKIALFTSLLLIIVGTLVIFCFEFNNPRTLQPLGWSGKLLAAYFQAVSPRTCGFVTVNLGYLQPVIQFFIILLMFIGASPGSTGGGIKTTTFAALMTTVWSVFTGKSDISVWRRNLPKELILKALTVTVVSLGLVILVSMFLLVTEKADFLTVLFETTSAFGTVGLTMGLTPQLTVFGKILIIFTMYAGRVGPLTLAFALAQRRHRVSRIKYLEENILIG